MDHIPSFEITTYDFAAKHYSDWIFPYDYHYLYILENGKDAYIGETNDIKVRTGDHRKKADFCHQFHFRRIHVITGIDITATPAKHYENMLIKLMEIDQKFHVRNTEPGVRTFYHSKNEFELGFDQLWQKLAEKGLVSHMEFKTILNSSEYKYSPFTRLTPLQQEALESTINALHCSDSQKQRDAKHTRPILIKGDAGTGKTVVAASLFYHLKQDPAFSDKKVCLVYANPATREELKSVFRCIPGKYQDDIIAPIHVTKKHYDIVICDEAQHLRRDKNLGAYGALLRKNNERLALPKDNNELDWLLAYSDYQVLLYDKKQLSTPMDLPAADFNRLLDVEHGGIRPVALHEQMRIRAGSSYVPYIYDVLYQRAETPISFENYDFGLFSSFQDMFRVLNEKDEIYGMCLLCSGYAWEWTSKNDPSHPDIVLDGTEIWWNRQTGKWLRNPEAKLEMGSIYSLVGLDLNYAAVVIGPDLYYDRADQKIKVNKKHYFDNKVKTGGSDEELREYVLNTYAVLLTRGIYGTYVYVCDEALREYLQQYIPSLK